MNWFEPSVTVATTCTVLVSGPPIIASTDGAVMVMTGATVSTRKARATTVWFPRASVAVVVQVKVALSAVGRGHETLHEPPASVAARLPPESAQFIRTPVTPEPSETAPVTVWVRGLPRRCIALGTRKVSVGPCVSTSTWAAVCVTLPSASCARSVTERVTRSRFGGKVTASDQAPFACTVTRSGPPPRSSVIVTGPVESVAAPVSVAEAPTTPLPDSIRYRRKTGFSTPVGRWLRETAGEPTQQGIDFSVASRTWARSVWRAGWLGPTVA